MTNSFYDPQDPTNEPNLDKYLPEPLVDVELQLRGLRPRQPQLDIAAIISMSEEKTSHLNRAPSQFPRLAGALAASWICGAAVGAACVFAILSQPQPMSSPPMVTEVSPKNTDSIPPTMASHDLRQQQLPPTQPITQEAKSTRYELNDDQWLASVFNEQLVASSSLRNRKILIGMSNKINEPIAPVPYSSSFESTTPTVEQEPATQAGLMREMLELSGNKIH